MKAKGVLATATVVAGLVVAGCGSGDSDSGSGASGGPAGSTVKIGLVAPRDNPSMSYPEAEGAAKAAVRALNARGGLAGHKVELVYCNDKGDPNETTNCAREMTNNKVIATVGGGILNGQVLTPALAAASIPQIGPTAYTIEFQSPNVYLFSGGPFFGYQTLSMFAAKNNLPTTMVSEDNSTAVPLRKTLSAMMASAGSNYTGTVLIGPTAADLQPMVENAKRGGAKAALMFTGVQHTTGFMAASEQAGADLRYLSTTYLGKSDVDKIGGPAVLSKVTYAIPFPPFTSDVPAMKQFRDELAKEAATGDKDASLDSQTLVSFQTWLGVYAIEQLVKKNSIADPTAAEIKKALDSAKDLDLGGAIPPWTPNAPGPKGFPRVSNTAYYLSTFHDGKQELLSPDAVSAEDLKNGTKTVPAAGS